ncbi:MAG: choice-of-anchor I family protein, partial [Bacteroidetes bacterium]|nr:choice-of-anchor I family protein [Bacteroidota bacterium]
MRNIKYYLISVLLLMAVSLSAQQFQGFEGTGSDNWKFTLNFKRYNFISLNDQWADTSEVGSSTTPAGAVKAMARTGKMLWAMRDLDNPVTNPTSASQSPWHYMDFDAVNIAAYNSNELSFYYFSYGFDATDSIGYIVEYDNGTTWNFSNYINLNKSSNAWNKVQVSVPSGKTHVRLRLMAKQNGNDDWAAWEDVSLISSNVDKTPPRLLGGKVSDVNTIQLYFNEELGKDADSTKNYSGINGIVSAKRSTTVGPDTVTLKLNPAIVIGRYYNISVSTAVKDTAGNAPLIPLTYSFVFNNTRPSLVITEIMYNSPSNDPDTLDFIEVMNTGTGIAQIGGFTFHNGLTTQLPELSVAPGSFVLIGHDSAACKRFYRKNFLQYLDALSNGGEALFIRNTEGQLIDSVNYDDAAPWPLGPPTPDGGGTSLEIIDYRNDNNVAGNWKVAAGKIATWNGTTDIFASPGSAPLPTIPVAVLSSNLQSLSEATDSISVTVSVSNANTNPVQVRVVLVPKFGTAKNDSDFFWKDTTLLFSGNFNGSKSIRFAVNKDANAEADEYFALRISSVINGVSGSIKEQIIYLKDDDIKAPAPRKNLNLKLLSSYAISGTGNSAEISAYDAQSKRMFVSNSLKSKVHILDFSNPSSIKEISQFDVAPHGGINSVAVYKGIIALAVEDLVKTNDGYVLFIDTAGKLLNKLKVGALPDMICFSPDGSMVLTANEGEPLDDYSVDPEGSVSVISMSTSADKLTQADVNTMRFTAWNGKEASLRAAGIRIFGNNNPTASQDLEPEYVAVSDDNKTAWVTLQENNAVAIVNLVTKTIDQIVPLGSVDLNNVRNAADVSDQGTNIHLANFPVKANHSPDAITFQRIAGKSYLLTANEGDYREYAALTEEVRVSALKLDSAKFPEQGLLKSGNVLGRLSVSSKQGDLDNDGDIDEIYINGSRGFSIWDAASGAMVYHSGSDFERYTATDAAWKPFFNASHNVGAPALKNRSDNKGPEPEGVVTAVINDTTYAFVSLERIGGVMVYDISKPAAPVFVTYANNRFIDGKGDFGPEGIIFIPADKSPTAKLLLVLSNEISGTLSVFEVGTTYPVARVNISLSSEVINEKNEFSELRYTIQPPLAYPATLLIRQQRSAHTSLNEYTSSSSFIGDSLKLELNPGTSAGSVFITTVDDQIDELNDTIVFNAELRGFLAANGNNTTLRLVILDDDVAPTGTEEQESLRMQVFPNPTTGVLQLGITGDHVRILNQQGQCVAEYNRVSSINV